MAYNPNKTCIEVQPEYLDFAIKNNKNVLIVGEAGCGKTTMIRECFNRFGLVENKTWKYYSTPTLDPWINFVGVPQEKKTGELSYLDFIRPLEIASGEMEAFFFDEFNRAATEVKQAVMELIQFKSINGLKFPKLRVVWAAINPFSETNDTYDTAMLDKAQKDRFQMWFNAKCKIDIPYFSREFGDKVAKIVAQWWNKLPDDIKEEVTPRRMEEACRIAEVNPQMMSAVLIPECNPSELIKLLSGVPFIDRMRNFFRKNDKQAMSELVGQSGSFATIRSAVSKPREFQDMMMQILDCNEPQLEKEKKFDREQLMTLMLESLRDEDMMAVYSASDEWVKKQIINIPNLGSEIVRNRFVSYINTSGVNDPELSRILNGESGATLADTMTSVLRESGVSIPDHMSVCLALGNINDGSANGQLTTEFVTENVKKSLLGAWRKHYLKGRSLVNIPASYKNNIVDMVSRDDIKSSYDMDLFPSHNDESEIEHFNHLLTSELAGLKVLHDIVLTDKGKDKEEFKTGLRTMLSVLFKNWCWKTLCLDRVPVTEKQVHEGNVVQQFCTWLSNTVSSTAFRDHLLAGTEQNDSAKRVVARDAWFDLYALVSCMV